jgi:hypothetical protein
MSRINLALAFFVGCPILMAIILSFAMGRNRREQEREHTAARAAEAAKRAHALNIKLCVAALAVALQAVTACSDYERFRGRTPEQAKQACDPQRQTPEECSRTLDK